MVSSAQAAWFSGIAAPLSAKFGGNLIVSRTGNTICWGYEGQSAIVEFMPKGSLRATFVDAERIDAVSGSPAAAAYRTNATYGLDRPSCARMIADMVDFFSGVREPKFAFFAAHSR